MCLRKKIWQHGAYVKINSFNIPKLELSSFRQLAPFITVFMLVT